MKPSEHPGTCFRLAVVLLWILTVVQAAVLFGWPVLAGLRCVNDEYLNLIGAVGNSSMADNVLEQWHSRGFRPIGLPAGYTISPETLDARWTLLFHLPAYLALGAALIFTTRRLLPGVGWAVPFALCWFMMHTSTMVLLYLTTAQGHSWAAGAGVWLLILTWNTLERHMDCRELRWNVYALVALNLLGVNTSEIYYGWCLAAGLALGCGWVWVEMTAKPNPSRYRVSLLAFGVLLVTIPLMHMAMRILAGGLGIVFQPDQGRYSASLGLNFWRNLGIAFLGWFSAVPVHWARLPNAPLLQRVVPFIGILLAAGLCVLPWALRKRSIRTSGCADNGWLVLLVAVASFLGVSATLPTGNMSESYLLGVNIGSAVLLAVGVALLIDIARRTWVRMAVIVAVALVLVIGEVGVVSRAVNFAVGWSNAGELYAQVRTFQKRAPPRREPYLVLVPRELRAGFTHGQYVHPPAISLNLGLASLVANRLSPQARVKPTPSSEASVGDGTAAEDLDAHADLILDGRGLVARPSW